MFIQIFIIPLFSIAGFFIFGQEARAGEIIIGQDTIWDKGEIRVIDDPNADGLVIMAGAKLTILPGAVIKLGRNTPIAVMGELNIQGSENEPVVITSLKNDAMGGDTNGDGTATIPRPGDWYGIMSNSPAAKINIDYAEISYGGGYEDNYAALFLADQINSFSIAHSSLIHDTGVMFIGRV